jgi:hypothetical protein
LEEAFAVFSGVFFELSLQSTLFKGGRGDGSTQFGGLPRACSAGSEVFGVVNCLSDEALKLFLPAILFVFSPTKVSGGRTG